MIYNDERSLKPECYSSKFFMHGFTFSNHRRRKTQVCSATQNLTAECYIYAETTAIININVTVQKQAKPDT